VNAKALVLVIALLAGCTTPEPSSTSLPDTMQAAATFQLDAQGCTEAGAYVTWNAFPNDPDLPPGFDTRHVSKDIGDPPFTTVGGGPTVLRTPADAVAGPNVTGAYHPIMRCATWTLDGVEKKDLWIAWVAAFVHAPTYDPAPLERTYSVGAIGVNDADLAAALARAGIKTERLTVTDFSLDAANMRHAFAFDHHGTIYADVPMREIGAKPEGTTRYWAVASEKGQSSHPVALDIRDAGGKHLVASAPGAFEHTVNGPAPASIVPAHTFSSWALAYTGFSRSITMGPVVNVTVDAGGHVHAP
jgi:hypothetical protein